MDFFRGIGNFFKGAFGGDSEEEKRRKQQAAQQQKQQLKVTQAKPQPTLEVKKPQPQPAAPLQVKPAAPTPQPLKVVAPPPVAKKPVNPVAGFFGSMGEGAGRFVHEVDKLVVAPVVEEAQKFGKQAQLTSEIRKKGGFVNGVTEPDKKTKKIIEEAEKKTGTKKMDSGEAIGNVFSLASNAIGAGEAKNIALKTGEGIVATGKQMVKELVDKLASPEGRPLIEGKTLPDVLNGVKSEVERRIGRNLTEEEATHIAKEATDQMRTPRGEADIKRTPADKVEQDLQDVIDNPNEIALKRKKAQDELNAKRAAEEKKLDDADPLNKPTFEHLREIKAIATREEENLNRYINEHPELTDVQRAAAQQAAKERVMQLTDELTQNRAAALNAVDDQAKNLADNASKQADVVDEVQQNRVEAATPQEGDRLQTPETAPEGAPAASEVEANNGYTDSFSMTDKVLEEAGVDTTVKDRKLVGLKKFFHKATGGIVSDPYKQIVDKVRDAVGDVAYKMTASNNTATNSITRLNTLFANNSVLKDSIRQVLRVRNDGQAAAGDAVKRLSDSLSEKISKLPEDVTHFNRRLDQLFETPEFLARKYGDDTAPLTIHDLAPAEREIADTLIEMNKMRNLALYKQGKISEGEFQMFADGMHSPRLYDFEKLGQGGKGGNKLIDTTSTIKRKELGEISDETFAQLIESPAQRMLIRLEMALRSQASHDALKALDDAGMLKNVAPNNQFSKLVGSRWGEFEGKYVFNPIKGQLSDSMVMNTKAGQTFNDLLDMYRDSAFGKVDRFMKKTKTVYSPGTFIGNVASNPLLFNKGAGVTALGQTKRMAKAGFDLAMHRSGKKFDADIYEAQKYGVFSSDTGKQITGRNNPELSVTKDGKVNPFEATYGGADDAAKLAIWRGLRARGVSPELAARRVSQFTQDYNNAGRLVQTLADMPVIGRPFARFAPELMRLVKNNVLYNPVGMVAGAGTIALIQDEMSQAAGETPEEREARETSVGQTLIPGTQWLNKMLTGTDRNISLNFPVGDTAVNIARAVGMNFPQDTSGDPNMALIKQLVPWAIPTRENAQGEQVFAPEELFTSLAMSPIAQEVANRDFMGRTITDPTNKKYYEGNGYDVTKFSGEPNQEDQLKGRLQHLLMNFVPLASEANTLYSAAQNEGDYYGKERTIPEAIMRVFGAKAESNTQDDQAKRVETKQYFEEDLPAVQKFVTDNPDLADAYFKLKNPTRNRVTNQKESDLVTPEKWDIINSDTSGRLFTFLKDQSIKQYYEDAKPVDPVYLIPEDEAKYVSELRSRPSGDDIEAQEILRATTDWFPAYEKRYHEYLTKNSEYFDSKPKLEGAAEDNPRVKAYGEASAPIEQPAIIKEYYQIKAQDPEKAKQVYKANKEALSAAFDKYANDRLARINTLRKIEGYDPISAEVFKNKTFGFDPTPSGFGFGGGGGGAKDVNTLGRLTDFSKDITALAPMEAQAMPQLQQLFASLQAQKSGGRAKPKLGASSRGQ